MGGHGGPDEGAAAPSGRDPGERRRTRRRRAVAPPTNPASDQSDDVPSGKRRDPAADDRRARDTAHPRRLDPRDSWILEQRPPHWD